MAKPNHPAKRNRKVLSLKAGRSRRNKVPAKPKFKTLTVSQLRADVQTGNVTVYQADGGSIAINTTTNPKYAVQPGDEFAGDHASAHDYRLQDTLNANADVVIVTGDGSNSSDVVEIPDASFFNSVDSYYDEDGQTSFVLDGSDGVIGIRG